MCLPFCASSLIRGLLVAILLMENDGSFLSFGRGRDEGDWYLKFIIERRTKWIREEKLYLAFAKNWRL